MGGHMGETTGSRFDRLAEEAWTRFRARLADHVAEMGDDDVLIVDTDPDDAATGGALPYVQFCAYDAGWVRCEVSSNAYLVPDRRLDVQEAAAVVALGWSDPADGETEPGNFYVDAERVEADRLAVMTVRVLREVFGVPHPSFLAAGGLELEPGQGAADNEPPTAPAEPLAVRPRDRDHLRELVDEALTPFLGQTPEHDEDDDIPVPTRTSVVFVRVREDMPVVQMFAFVADDVEDTAAARFEVAVLNRDERFFKFSLVADSVMVELDLPALPFAPAHARDLLGILCATVDRIQPDLQERIGGTADADDERRGRQPPHRLLEPGRGGRRAAGRGGRRGGDRRAPPGHAHAARARRGPARLGHGGDGRERLLVGPGADPRADHLEQRAGRRLASGA